MSINLNKLSEEEEKFIKNYDWKNISDEDKEFAEKLGLNPNDFSKRDKVLFFRAAKDLAEAIRAYQ